MLSLYMHTKQINIPVPTIYLLLEGNLLLLHCKRYKNIKLHAFN